ncbi:MAG: CHAT domain-containing protein [Flavobacteriales bacterium]|nr:CHAT domain-containing protein [Flavobacteriales bacterium]
MAFSQSRAISLEDKIYNAVDAFVAQPNAENLKKLEKTEVTFSPKTKPELLAFVILKCNKAYYENQLGFTQKAIKSYEKAWQLYQKNKLSSYDITESCLKPLGNLYAIIGDYDSAENTIKQYYYIANLEQNQEQKYAAILNLSNVYQNTGRIIEAIDLLEKTLKTERLTTIQKGNLWNNLGTNYLLSTEKLFAIKSNPFIKGEEAFKKTISLLQSEKNQSQALSNAYRNLAKIEARENHFEKAKEWMEKSRDLFFENPNSEPRKQAQLYYDIALLDFQSAAFDESQINLKAVFNVLIPNYSATQSVLPKKNDLYAETVLLDALDLQAELFLTQNQPKKALESYNLAFHIEELFQSMLVYENSKIINQVRNRNRTEKCLEIYFSLYKKEQKISYIEAAFLLAEKTKSAVLRQSLLDSKHQSREEKLMVEQLQNWNTTILKEQQKLDDADISKINEAIQKQNELMLLLKSKFSKKDKESYELNLADLYSKLKKNQAMMIEYFVGFERMYFFTIENNKIQLNRLKTEGRAILNFISYFNDSDSISKNPAQFNSHAHNAYSTLKIPKAWGYKKLIIIPDGILTLLPFEALVTEESSTTNFAKMKFLLYEYAIGYSNSADFYLNSIPFKRQKESVLGIFPVFEKTNLELAFSKKEKQKIQSYFDGMYFENGKATLQNFKKNAANYSIIHLSTHASSGDLVTPASIKFYDQEVLYSELYHLEMNPDLVVLSACETGIGKLYKAEGAMSVARGFQFAGVQNILFSLWKVNDYTTSVLMDKFYSNMKNGKSYFESTNQAKLDYLADESIPNAKKSPYYWSSFVYYGTLDKKESGNYWIWVSIVGALSILMIIWLFLSFRRRRNLIK